MLNQLNDFKKKFDKAIKKELKKYKPYLTDYLFEFLSYGGKRLRPLLTYSFYKALGGKSDSIALKASVIPEVIHNATLLHDDIEDNSALRRGKPCMHVKHGVPLILNLGDWMYFLIHDLTSKLGLSNEIMIKVYDAYFKAMQRVTEGQALDIGWSELRKYDLTVNDYLIMVKLKTGSIARLAAELGSIIGGASINQFKSFGEFAELIGAAFQIQDDLLDLTGGEEFGKMKCHDIIEGKKSLMIVHALNNAGKEDVKLIIKIFNKKYKTKSEVNQVLSILKKCGSFDYAKKKADQLVNQAINKLKLLPEGNWKDLIKDLSLFVIKRSI